MSSNPIVIQRTQVRAPYLLVFQCLASLDKFLVSLKNKGYWVFIENDKWRRSKRWKGEEKKDSQNFTTKHRPCVSGLLRSKSSWLAHTFSVFFSMLQSKTHFPWMRWHWLLFHSKNNWDNGGNFYCIGTFPLKRLFCIGGNYFCQCTYK